MTMKSNGKQVGNFTDNAQNFIIAFDFDGTVTVRNEYPKFGYVRPYIQDVFQILREAGARVVIWTCRDCQDIDPLQHFLRDNGIECDSINSSIEFAPFEYESRKIYAHRYVDDRGYGWKEKPDIILSVGCEFLENVMGCPHDIVYMIRHKLLMGCVEDAMNLIRMWRGNING